MRAESPIRTHTSEKERHVGPLAASFHHRRAPAQPISHSRRPPRTMAIFPAVNAGAAGSCSLAIPISSPARSPTGGSVPPVGRPSSAKVPDGRSRTERAMSRQPTRREQPPWSVIHGSSDPRPGQVTDSSCASCGRPTDDAVLGTSMSVTQRDGGRRFAPPMPLCAVCRRDVLQKHGWLPTWCAGCQRWRPFGHEHRDVLDGATAVSGPSRWSAEPGVPVVTACLGQACFLDLGRPILEIFC